MFVLHGLSLCDCLPRCWVLGEACGSDSMCTCALQIELSHVDSNTNNPFVNSHVRSESRWIQQKAQECEQKEGGGGSIYVLCLKKLPVIHVCG